MYNAEEITTDLGYQPFDADNHYYEALDAFTSDTVARGWLGNLGVETYVGMKRAEIALAGDVLDDALCARYAGIY